MAVGFKTVVGIRWTGAALIAVIADMIWVVSYFVIVALGLPSVWSIII